MQVLRVPILFGAGKKFPSKYGGDRQNIKIQLPDGSDLCIWFNAGEFSHLRKGQEINVVVDAGVYKIAEKNPDYQPNAATPNETPQPLPQVSSSNIRESVNLYSEIFGYCLIKTRADFSSESESSQVAIASAIFEQTVKKFGV